MRLFAGARNARPTPDPTGTSCPGEEPDLVRPRDPVTSVLPAVDKACTLMRLVNDADAAPIPPDDDPNANSTGRDWKGWAKFALRWGIAVVGVAWVVSGLTIRDRVYVLDADAAGRPVLLDAALAAPFDPEVDATARYVDPRTDEEKVAPRDRLLHGPDRDEVDVNTPAGEAELRLAGMRLREPADGLDRNELPTPYDLHVYTAQADDEAEAMHVRRLETEEWAGNYALKTPQPLVRVGLATMVSEARPVLLTLAILVFPITLVATGLRWWRLMAPLGLQMSLKTAYALNMVGLFYNSFMLGSTGGDFIKAYYAGRHARPGQKAAAWLSVFVDRVIGLITLVVMGGTASTVQWLLIPDSESAVAVACRQVMWASGTLVIAGLVGLYVATHQAARRRTGISFMLHKIGPEGGRVRDAMQSAYDVIDAYRRRPGLVLEACLLTVPVHASVILSAMLAGTAFGLPIPWPYYFVCVPVIVLSASMPISPQGAGVMEFFAVLLLRPQGATVAQAFALTVSIRVVQILWNLTGGLVVLRGGYGQPAGASGEEAVLPESPVSAAA